VTWLPVIDLDAVGFELGVAEQRSGDLCLGKCRGDDSLRGHGDGVAHSRQGGDRALGLFALVLPVHRAGQRDDLVVRGGRHRPGGDDHTAVERGGGFAGDVGVGAGPELVLHRDLVRDPTHCADPQGCLLLRVGVHLPGQGHGPVGSGHPDSVGVDAGRPIQLIGDRDLELMIRLCAVSAS